MAPKTDKSKGKDERKRLNKLLDKSRGQLVNLQTWIDSHGKSANLETLQVQLDLTDNHYKRCFEYDEMITELLDEDEDQEEESESNDYEQVFVTTKSRILALIKLKAPAPKPAAGTDPNQSIVMAKKSVKLPKLHLPKFSGKYSEWLDFKNEFTSMVMDVADLTDVDRFRFLKSCLVDGARRSISQMEVSSENFKGAWSALVERYENKALMFQTHINDIILISTITKESADGIREMHDRVTAHYRALASLGSKDELAENLLICLMLSKLDSTTAIKWEESTTKDIPTWEGFCTFMEKRASTLEKIDYNKKQTIRVPVQASVPRSTNANRRNRSALITTNHSTFATCIKCESKDHALATCSSFTTLSPDERYQYAKGNRICVLCLDSKHSTRNCRVSACQRCHKRHHTMLHFEIEPPSSISRLSANEGVLSTEELSKKSTSLVTSCEYRDESAILATAIVHVLDNKGSSIPCRALLDSGASANFVSERFSQTLNVERHKLKTSIGGIGSSSTSSKGFCRITIVPRFGTAENLPITAVILSKITDAQPPHPISLKGVSIPADVQLADPLYFQPQTIDLLIGAGLFWNLLLPGKRFLGENLPILQETKLGWTVSGPYCSSIKSENTALLTVTDEDSVALSLKRLDKLVSSFWEIESYPIADLKMSPKDQECEDHYALHTRRTSIGSYIVRLPFSKDPSYLGESYHFAMRRFLNLEKRLYRLPEIRVDYAEFIQEYQTLKHLEVVNDFDATSPHYFLPHRCVFKVASSSTKLRVVFDGSCKTSSSMSLNDILHAGPKIQEDIFIILLRFRMFRYVLTGDIQKMYRQIQVAESDRNFQLILRRFNRDEPVKIFRLCTVTYGTAPGAYLAIRTLYRLATDEGERFPIAAQVLRRNFYVDDMMVGANSIEELVNIRQQITKLLKAGGFSLTKFCSNEEEIIHSIPTEQREKFLRIDDHDVVKALGLIWQPMSDVFRYSYSPKQVSDKITKRVVLSEIASLFDPLGLVCPVITRAKIFYQDLWKLKMDWDKELNSDLSASWRRFRAELDLLGTINVQRFVCHDIKNSKIELHAFSDASEKAYAACIYLRSSSEEHPPIIRLLCAKSRVAPTKTVTIARLELLAAKLLIDLVCRIKREVLSDITVIGEYYWTDSSICLCWLNKEPHNWNTFVAHRVAKIQQMSNIECWRHVPGNINPADIASRGAMPSELSNAGIWFNGPEFLLKSEAYWPPPHTPIECEDERRSLKLSLLGMRVPDITDSMSFSDNFRGTRRSFVFVMRFYKGCCSPAMTKKERRLLVQQHQFAHVYAMIPPVTYSEEIDIEYRFLRNIQQAAYPDEYAMLSNDRAISPSSQLRNVAPFLDDQGVLQVGGRIKKAELSYDARHQIILPKTHRYSKAIIEFFHCYRTLHSGPQTVLTAIRSRYWIVTGLVACRSIIRKCVWCFRMRTKIRSQFMGSLPKDCLLYKNVKPFVTSGVDFAGPLIVRHHIRCKVGKKMYVALFVSMITKAVHLELVVDLSTEAFVRALKRVIADRGVVTKIYSDNAKNFLGTANQLREVKDMLSSGTNVIHEACTSSCVEWSFIPPRAPNFGGLWEASIKIMKRLIRNVVGEAETTVDDLQTIIKQVASVINSRPITPVSGDVNDLQPLTPGHFIYGGPPAALPELPLDVPISRIKLHQHVTWTVQQFWRRFQKEYLTTLQTRSRWNTHQENLREVMMVLLRDDLLPPLCWSVGRIVKTIPDDEGTVRIVRVLTHRGEYDRSISGVAVLPIEDNELN